VRPGRMEASRRVNPGGDGGVHYVRHSPLLLGAASLDLFAVLLGGPVALMPIFAHEILHQGRVD